MTKEIFNKGIKELLIAFPKMEISKETAIVWYKYSKDLKYYIWEQKIRDCIKNCPKSYLTLADILDRDDKYSELRGGYRV